VNQPHGPDCAEISRAWLAGGDFGSPLADVITQTLLEAPQRRLDELGVTGPHARELRR
jgi:hypothetical protein